MGVWDEPTTATLYTEVLTKLKGLAARAATLMNINVDDTDVPAGAIKWSTSNNRFEVYNAGWKELRDTSSTDEDVKEKYNINVSMLGGYLGSSYRDISKMTSGFLSPFRFNSISHGVITDETSHNLSSAISNGFMSKAQFTKLNGLVNRTDAAIATAYDSERYTLVPNNLTVDSTVVKKVTGAALGSFIEAKLASGVHAVTFNGVYDSGTVDIDIARGQYQKLILIANTTISFKPRTTPYTMYLYINTQNTYTCTLPPGKWSGGQFPITGQTGIKSEGIDLLTINFDGVDFYYMLLADMR